MRLVPGAQCAGTPFFQTGQCTGISPSPAGVVEGAFFPFMAHFPVLACLGPPALGSAQVGTIPIADSMAITHESQTASGHPSTRSWMWIRPQRHTVEIDLATQKPYLPISRGG